VSFGKVLSSITIAEAPAASYCGTTKLTFTALPNPVSMSAMRGTEITAAMARIISRCVPIERMLASGTA
jgi:hypothetical protein